MEENGLQRWKKLQLHRQLLQSLPRDTGIAASLSFLEDPEFFPLTAGPLRAIGDWNDDDPQILNMRMEDIVLKPNEFLEAALNFQGYDVKKYRLVDPEKFTFKAITGRDIGEVDPQAHMRSGNPDDWRTTLPKTVQDYIKITYRACLEKYYPESLE